MIAINTLENAVNVWHEYSRPFCKISNRLLLLSFLDTPVNRKDVAKFNVKLESCLGSSKNFIFL